MAIKGEGGSLIFYVINEMRIMRESDEDDEMGDVGNDNNSWLLERRDYVCPLKCISRLKI